MHHHMGPPAPPQAPPANPLQAPSNDLILDVLVGFVQGIVVHDLDQTHHRNAAYNIHNSDSKYAYPMVIITIMDHNYPYKHQIIIYGMFCHRMLVIYKFE